MKRFKTDAEARAFVRERVDIPVVDRSELLDGGIQLRTFSQELDDGTFTNVYDLILPPRHVRSSVELHDELTGVYNRAKSDSRIRAATSGGFFFLVDQASKQPRELSLNLAFSEGQMRSFPSVDREAFVLDGERLSAEHIQALGTLSIGNTELSWSGSLTHHDTDVKVFGNGNSAITHVQNDATGSIRVLDENSRYTSAIIDEDTVDIGFIRRDDGVFEAVSCSENGNLDIFSHDVVLRGHESSIHNRLPTMTIRTIGNRAVDGSLRGAISVGPMVDELDFTGHPINSDKSLGSKPPFLDVPLARTVLYETSDGTTRIRLFDGRPGSATFPGVTPMQAADSVLSDSEITWGCFLDPGQTAKLAIRNGSKLASYGNTHYLKWPAQQGGNFVWVPKKGRPVASTIVFR